MRSSGWFMVLGGLSLLGLVGVLGVVRSLGPSDAVWVAFHAEADGGNALYISSPDGGTVRPLLRGLDTSFMQLFWLDTETLGMALRTPNRNDLYQLHISGAGGLQALAVERSPYHWAATDIANYELNASILYADLDLGNGVGAGLRLLYDHTRGAEIAVIEGSLNPAGTRFAFACLPPLNRDLSAPENGLCSADYAAHTTPGSTHPDWLATAHFVSPQPPPHWSPDGRWVTFAASTTQPISRTTIPEPDIWRVEVETGILQRITDFAKTESDPQFSPDGEWIVFSAHLRNDTNLYRLRASGGGLRQVTANAAYDRFPHYTPTGKHIIFVSDRTGFYELYRVPTAGFEEDVQQITRLQRDIFDPPALSPAIDRRLRAGLVALGGLGLLVVGGTATFSGPSRHN